MERYEKYKDSGVEWIGEIPEGWDVKKLKYVADLKSGSNLTSNQIKVSGKYPVYGGNGLRGYYNDYTHEGEFVLIGRQGALCGNINYASGKFWATDHAIVTQHHILRYEWFWLGELLCTMNLNQYSVAAAQPGLSVETIKNLLIPYPMSEQQTTIANYLKQKTAQIDKLIAQKEQLIELYEEEKTAIINQAVTKGISPDIKFKDSGVDWLGEIPEAWEVKRLKRITKNGLQNGIFKKSKDFGSGTNLVNVSDIYRDNFFIDEISLERVVCSTKELRTYTVTQGDIFFVRSSLKREGIAKVACFANKAEPAVFECHLVKISPLWINYRYLNYYLNSNISRDRLISLSITTTMTTISQDSIGGFQITVPPIEEQDNIVEHIESENVRINAKIKKTKKIIELQKEYRTALISEVVTGKIKVTQESAS